MINQAYVVETGDSGVAFKKTARFVSEAEVNLDATHVLMLGDAAVGCISRRIITDDDGVKRGHFGPLAVLPEEQGKVNVSSNNVSSSKHLCLPPPTHQLCSAVSLSTICRVPPCLSTSSFLSLCIVSYFHMLLLAITRAWEAF